MDGLERKLTVERDQDRISVQFYRFENRFGHQIDIDLAAGSLKLRTDDALVDEWPPSPPLQDIHFEDRGEHQLLFGVGMAGQTHYSLSIDCDLRHELKFEFAARLKALPDFLGTRYRLMKDDLGGGHARELLGLVSVDMTTALHVEFSEGKTETLTVMPAAARTPNPGETDGETPTWQPADLPITAQWSFALRLGTNPSGA